MTEIIWYGRGGQGAFTAAKLLGAAYALKGNAYYALAFPSFGPERRGAPIRAFTKLDIKPILDRSKTEKTDYIVILDETLYSNSLKNLLKPGGKIVVNADVLEDAFKKKPKALILCNPSNPCGKVFTYDELKIIADLAEKYDTFVITDEVYEHILYVPHKHTYFASLPKMRDRTISCGSLSKTYSITGWRLGYVIAPPYIIDTVRKVHDFLTVGAPAPLQEAAVVGLRFGDDYYEDLQRKYTEKRELLLNGLDGLKISHTTPE